VGKVFFTFIAIANFMFGTTTTTSAFSRLLWTTLYWPFSDFSVYCPIVSLDQRQRTNQRVIMSILFFHEFDLRWFICADWQTVRCSGYHFCGTPQSAAS